MQTKKNCSKMNLKRPKRIEKTITTEMMVTKTPSTHRKIRCFVVRLAGEFVLNLRLPSSVSTHNDEVKRQK